jgi:hypothetical protein
MNSIPLSTSEEMHLLAQQLNHHFSPTQLEEIAKKASSNEKANIPRRIWLPYVSF